MNFFIAFFLPSILGLLLYISFTKEKENMQIIINYLLNVLFSNMLGIAVVLVVLSTEVTNLVETIENNLVFSFKYMGLTMVISVVVSIIVAIVRKYLVFSIEVENGRKRKN